MVYQTAGGTATVLTLTIKGTLVNGYPITFIASANNGGASTTINGKSLYKPGTTTAPTLIAGKAYTIWYNSASSCFFIKASAEGNTVASHVLAGDTFSNDTDTGLIGTMPLRSNTGGNGGNANWWGSYEVGYTSNKIFVRPVPNDGSILAYTGDCWVNANEVDVANAVGLTAAKILAGNIVCGITGTATNDAVLYPQYLLTGYSGYDDGVLKTGTMPNLSGNWQGSAFKGVYGTSVLAQIPKGYSDGGTNTYTVCSDANFIAANIISGVSIFGVAGNATIESLGGKRVVTGSIVCDGVTSSYSVNVGFAVNFVYIYSVGRIYCSNNYGITGCATFGSGYNGTITGAITLSGNVFTISHGENSGRIMQYIAVG
jgi:hypothetical protein